MKKAEDEIKNEIKEKTQTRKSLILFLEFLNKDTRLLEKHLSLYNEHSLILKNKAAVYEDKQAALNNINREFDNLKKRLINIQEIIKTEGLENLDKIIQELNLKLNNFDKELRSIDKKIGANEIQKAEAENELKEKTEALESCEDSYKKAVNFL